LIHIDSRRVEVIKSVAVVAHSLRCRQCEWYVLPWC